MSQIPVAEDDRDEVRVILEAGLTELKEWLDGRLQLQENLLRCISKLNDAPRRQDWKSSSNGKCEPVEVIDLGVERNSPSIDEKSGTTLKEVATCKFGADGPTLPGCLPEDGPTLPDLEHNHEAVQAMDWFQNDGRSANEARFGSVYSQRSSLVLLAEWHQQDWQSKLMDCFDQLDIDRSGSIDRHEIMEAFSEVGLPPLKSFDVFKRMDKTSNGVVDRVEWLRVIEEAARSSAHEEDQLADFVERLAIRQRDKGRIYEKEKHRPFCLIRHDSIFRMSWDVLMMILLMYISVMLPYSLGFGQSDTLEVLERIMDMIFCFDVILNFRTTYVDTDETIIAEGERIACKYLRTWFLLDFFSSVPMDLITAGFLPNLTPAKLLKIGKVAKVLKLLRMGKMLKVCRASELSDQLEEKSLTKAHQTLARLSRLLGVCFLLTHWLACFGVAIDTSCYDTYFAGQNPDNGQKYIAAVYWAMTTLSTVGYGDITPTSDEERIYAMFAMVVGGAFYGYIIGSITSVVADMDLNARAYYERMDLIQSWLDKHDEIPKPMRRNIRKYFKLALSRKAALDDSWVFSELTPELRADTAAFIIHERIRMNPMFIDVSNTALANLVEVVQRHHTNTNEFIVKDGDPGVAMYFLIDGIGRYDRGRKWTPEGTLDDESSPQRFQQLIPGDSFGEEIMFGLEETYLYTIITITPSTFHSISEDGFKDRYRNMPDLRKQMFRKFIRSRGGDPDVFVYDSDPVPHSPEKKDTNKLHQAFQEKESIHPLAGSNPYRRK